jgi:putative transcriptional regulator
VIRGHDVSEPTRPLHFEISMNTPIGKQIIEGLQEFTEALEQEKDIRQKFNCHRVVLDLEPSEYGPERVKKTRQMLGASQVVFARFLGVSPNTVRAWEQGRNRPNDMACRFMDEIRAAPDRWRARLRDLTTSKAP